MPTVLRSFINWNSISIIITRRSFIYVVLLLLPLLSCGQGVSCDSLPPHYDSYGQALKSIRHASFHLHESCNTSSSSWIRGAEYYSCDGRTGFFLLKTDKQWYIHRDVPVTVWNGFKSASSRGSYYDNNIKGRYYFVP